MQINLMTFNIQHGFDHRTKAGINLPLMADTIKNCGGEIVSLNEVRGAGNHPEYTAQADFLANQLGYYYYFAPAIMLAGPYGNALLSKYPILQAETFPIEDPLVRDEKVYYETRCILKALIDIPGLKGGLTVFVSHFGLAKAEERNAVKKLCELLKDVTGPCVFMGDLNMSPDDEILKPVFDILKDTAVLFDKPKLSFPSDNPYVKIDYIFVDKNTEVLSADIPEIVASDHRPHIATINL